MFCLFVSIDGLHLTFPPFFFPLMFVYVLLFSRLFYLSLSQKKGGSKHPADQAARTGLGSLSAEARRVRRERRALIRNGTATESDFDAEIDAQGRELSAAVEERKQIDSKLEAAETRQAKYEKELEECKTALAAKHPGVDIVKLERKKERLEASIEDVLEKKEDLREDRRPLAARIKELGADIAALKQQMGAWHD